jgi:hypothetical protein
MAKIASKLKRQKAPEVDRGPLGDDFGTILEKDPLYPYADADGRQPRKNLTVAVVNTYGMYL